MANLLTKFRIKYSKLTMLKGVMNVPKEETLLKHKTIVDCYNNNMSNSHDRINEDELQAMEDKTNRQLRIHELVVEHSHDAALIVMSLPMPRKVSTATKLSPNIPVFFLYIFFLLFLIGSNIGTIVYVLAGNANL